ncbi:MAG: type II secretion system F family protein, partial [Pontibacterium sp.]
MPTFSYIGRDVSGDKVEGHIDAEGAGHAATLLQSDGITPVKIEKRGKATQESGDDAKDPPGVIRIKFLEKVSSDELIMFCRQMHSLTKSGVPLTRAMRGLAGSIKNLLLKEALFSLCDELDKGNTLSSAMHKHPKVFSDLFTSIVHVGENTGRLEEAFKQMASYLELERNTIKNVKQATRYPIFVFIAIGIAITVINMFVMPAFKSVFENLGGGIPWQTKLLLAVSDFMVNWWGLLLVGIAGGVFAFIRWKQTHNGAKEWDRIVLRLPLIGNILYRVVLGRFARTFSMVLRAGVPIEQGLMVVSRAVGNLYIGDKVAGMRKSIERGESFTQAAARTEM